MHYYVLDNGDSSIVPSVKEMPKTEVISQTANLNHVKFEYSDGWTLETKTYPDKIELWSNRELIKKEDGKYHPKS